MSGQIILSTIVIISAAEKARNDSVRTLPRALILKLRAVAEISSGASTIVTMSYCPCVQNSSFTVAPCAFAICLKASALFGKSLALRIPWSVNFVSTTHTLPWSFSLLSRNRPHCALPINRRFKRSLYVDLNQPPPGCGDNVGLAVQSIAASNCSICSGVDAAGRKSQNRPIRASARRKRRQARSRDTDLAPLRRRCQHRGFFDRLTCNFYPGHQLDGHLLLRQLRPRNSSPTTSIDLAARSPRWLWMLRVTRRRGGWGGSAQAKEGMVDLLVAPA